MKFSNLSKGQKRCVLALFESNPKLKSSRKVTRKGIVETWEIMREAGTKVGFPNWLLTARFKNEEGFYAIPKPTANDIEEYLNPKKKIKEKKIKTKTKKESTSSQIAKDFDSNNLSQEDMEYYAELKKYGIPF